MALNLLGSEKKERPAAPVTLPKFTFPPDDIESEIQEAAARAIEQRTIRLGRDAWLAVGKAGGWENWKSIGAALAVGKAHALRVTGANQAWGSAYSRAFNDWVKRHGFECMQKSVRSVAVELHENIEAVEQWRSTLSEKDRRRLVHPLSNVRRWRQATQPKAKLDAFAQAQAALHHFIGCVKALPTEQAEPLLQIARAEICHVCRAALS